MNAEVKKVRKKNKENAPVYWRIKKWVEKEGGSLKIPRNRLIEILGCSERTIRRAKKLIENLGWHWHYVPVEKVIEIHTKERRCSDEYLEYVVMHSEFHGQYGHSQDTERTSSGHQADTERTSSGHQADTERTSSGHQADTNIAFSKENETCTKVHEALTNVSEAYTYVFETENKFSETAANAAETFSYENETRKAPIRKIPREPIFEEFNDFDADDVDDDVVDIIDDEIIKNLKQKYRIEILKEREEKKKVSELVKAIDQVYMHFRKRKSFINEKSALLLFRNAQSIQIALGAVIGYITSPFGQKNYCDSNIAWSHSVIQRSYDYFMQTNDPSLVWFFIDKKRLLEEKAREIFEFMNTIIRENNAEEYIGYCHERYLEAINRLSKVNDFSEFQDLLRKILSRTRLEEFLKGLQLNKSPPKPALFNEPPIEDIIQGGENETQGQCHQDEGVSNLQRQAVVDFRR